MADKNTPPPPEDNHVFIYIGLLLWVGEVIVGPSTNGVPANYDLNNTNSYGSGLVTVWNIMIVNACRQFPKFS